jgi:hypothetical protein
VFNFGVVGPKTAIELAQKTLLILSSTATSKIDLSDIKLTSHARLGFCSPETDNKAAKW